MGKTYIIGTNSKLPIGEQSLSINVNAATDYSLSRVLSDALENKYPKIYEKITEQIIFKCFDELSKNDFLTVVREIRKFSNSSDLNEEQKTGVLWWNKLIEPLIVEDHRYEFI